LLACYLLSLIRDTVANTNAALVLVLLVVANAAKGIRLAGIAGALAAAIAFDQFLTEPYYALNCVPGTQGGEGLLVAAALATRVWALSGMRSATFERVLV